MNRDLSLARLQDQTESWDLLVIGGGATGLGCAVDAAARGWRTALIEQSDFAKATSSRSTKLIHGGFRYLKQGNLSLVRHSLLERGLLLRNAPHVVHRLAFIVPHYTWWERPYYGIGLRLYDWLAGQQSLGTSRHLTRQETLERLPTLQTAELRGGIRYFDGQFDDARLAINLAQTLHDWHGCAANHVAAVGLIKENGRLRGVRARDQETGDEFEIRAKAVINATGIFTDSVRRLDESQVAPVLTVSQGTHLVLDKSFLPGDHALMIPQTSDGRVLFAIPWHDRVLLGTTDVAMPAPEWEPRPLMEETEFLLDHARRYLTAAPRAQDVLSVFSGLRPLVAATAGGGISTSRLSRDHTILVSQSGLVTITGGKWTTYRQMAEEAVDRAARVAQLPFVPSRTRDLKLHGATRQPLSDPNWAVYGSDAEGLQSLIEEDPALGAWLHPRLPYRKAEILWAIRAEMARTVEDILARRTRALFLDAQASSEAASETATMLAQELGRDAAWARKQREAFEDLARGYLIGRPTQETK